MQIVIDIPNWLYNAILEHKEPTYSQSLGEAVRDGAPLPKGHGRLFDERDIVNGNYEIIGNKIYEVEPIIEADKAESEDEE